MVLGLWLLATIPDRTPALLLQLRVQQQVQPVLLALGWLLALAEVLVGVQLQLQVQVQVQLEGNLVLSRQHGLMDAEVQNKEEEQIVCSGTGEIEEGGFSSEKSAVQDGEGKDGGETVVAVMAVVAKVARVLRRWLV